MAISLEFPSSPLIPGYLLKDMFCSGLENMSEAQHDLWVIRADVFSCCRWHQKPRGCEEKLEE